ncbi:retrovirus-related Pol polyprotein from transposon 17.6 [Trichonephila clavipes]|nr:retrovirus-related Pol polyprotein from transposon 17.6 [Trichonephila clavipes]
MYGLNGAPAIWQSYVDGLFQGMDGVKVFMDDARITGSDEISHFTEHGLKLNLNKTSDASPVGIGCVLSHVYPDGSERPIAFASRTLSGSEKNTPKLIKKLFQ